MVFNFQLRKKYLIFRTFEYIKFWERTKFKIILLILIPVLVQIIKEVNEIEDAIPFVLLSALIEKNNKTEGNI